MNLIDEINSLNIQQIQEKISDPSLFPRFGVFYKANFINKNIVEKLAHLAENLVEGNYPTGLRPDIVKKPVYVGSSTDSNYINQVHSICNGWKSNSVLKNFILDAGFASYVKQLVPWKSVKLNQDSIYFVHPNSGSTAFHEDNPYQCWHTSNGGIITAWLALSEINCDSGGIEYLLGSHHANKINSKMIKGKFISDGANPYEELTLNLGDDWSKDFYLYRPVVKPGDLLIHHGGVWHGSSLNKSNKARISLSLHLMDGESKYSGADISPVYGKYKLQNSDEMNSTFFPDLHF